MWIPVAIGTVWGGLLVVSGGRRQPPAPSLGHAPACSVSVVLYGPDDGPSAAIDRATGGLGFSHVAVDACELGPLGERLVIDCSPGRGVTRRPAAHVERGRPAVRARLDATAGAELYGCVRASIGAPFSALGLLGISGGYVCSSLVWSCLPQRMRFDAGRPVSPNDFARAWGLRPGGPDVEV